MAALQGAWILTLNKAVINEGEAATERTAIEITGTSARLWDGRQEWAADLVIDAPCKVGFDGRADQLPLNRQVFIALNPGRPIFGTAGGEYRTADRVIVCIPAARDVFIAYDNGACLSRRDVPPLQPDGEWGYTYEPDHCSLTNKDGREEIHWWWLDELKTSQVDARSPSNGVEGDAGERYTDFAAAKAALSAGRAAQ